MSTPTSDFFCRANHLDAMASTTEDGREDPFSLLEDLGMKEAAIEVDSDNQRLILSVS